METSTPIGVQVVGLVIWLVFGLILALICGSIAGRKGYSAILFGVLGFFFACITLIVVLVIPRRDPGAIR